MSAQDEWIDVCEMAAHLVRQASAIDGTPMPSGLEVYLRVQEALTRMKKRGLGRAPVHFDGVPATLQVEVDPDTHTASLALRFGTVSVTPES